jgi:hypothetical protein
VAQVIKSPWTWQSLECETCGAEPGEDCFVSDRVWGRLPYSGPGGNTVHESRIEATLRHPDNPRFRRT